MRKLLTVLIFAGLTFPVFPADPPPSRLMNGINWIDFRQWVPERIDTVLLPVGTVEAHGVANNGADNTVPEAIARDLAEPLNAMIAPTISYGITNSLEAFPGSLRISEATFRAYAKEVIAELAKSGFKNLIVINGHGPNYVPLQEVCAEVYRETRVRTLVFNWWTLTADITKEVYGTDGGHAGVNETAAVIATNPEWVRKEYADKDLAWWSIEGLSPYPYPSSIILYKAEEGYPDFDEGKARDFYSKVLKRLEAMIRTTIEKWDQAGL